MKNMPARERQRRRTASSYGRYGKRPYAYPAWVTSPKGNSVPLTIRKKLLVNLLRIFPDAQIPERLRGIILDKALNA